MLPPVVRADPPVTSALKPINPGVVVDRVRLEEPGILCPTSSSSGVSGHGGAGRESLGIDDLCAAVRLVTGEPFSQL